MNKKSRWAFGIVRLLIFYKHFVFNGALIIPIIFYNYDFSFDALHNIHLSISDMRK